jgi:hypothetical protein
MIGKSTQLIGDITRIVETADTTEIASSSPRIKRRIGIFIALTTQISGARFIAPQDMIWKNAKLFWIARRCHRQQYRWSRSPDRANIDGPTP